MTARLSAARGLALASAALLLFLLGACTPEAEPTASGDAVVADASAACMGGGVDRAILQLDSLLSLGPRPDAYAIRAGCLRQRYARDSARADAEGAFADLGRAIDASGDGPGLAPDVLHSQRAFVRLTLDNSDLDGALEDLDQAVALAPESAVHRMDRSIARTMAGDTAGAREDLEWLASTPSVDSARAAEARQRLAALE